MDRVLIRKYLFGRNGVKLKSSHFLSLVGIVIGVIALIVVSAVMNGLRNDMMERIIDTKADIRVFHQNREPIENYTELTENIVRQRDITSVSPIILNELLLHKGEQVAAVSCYGIDYYQHRLITGLDNQIRIGSPETSGFQENGIIIGLDLSLTLNATVGEYIRVSSPLSTVPTPFGMIPKTQLMKVVAIFVSGMPEYDQAYSYMSLANARSFSNYENEIDFVLVKSTKPLNSRATAANLQRQLGSEYAVDDWSVFDASLFQAMRLEKSIMLTVLALMLIISGFNMGGNSLRLITEKRTELGILKAMGMRSKDLNRVFVKLNMLIGISGVAIGLIISTPFIVLQARYRFVQIPVPGFPIQWLPVSVRAEDYLLVVFVVLMISYLTTIIPLQKIKRIEPIKIIRGIE